MRTNPSFGNKADALRFISGITGETPEQIEKDLKASIKRARALTHPDRGIYDADKGRRHELFVKVGHALDAIEGFPTERIWEEPKREQPRREEPKRKRKPDPEPEPEWARRESQRRWAETSRPEPSRPQASNSGTYGSGSGTYGRGKSTY